MAGKLSFIAGVGAGYVLGARSGRDRYDQIVAKARDLWQDPRVQEKAGQAQQVVQEKTEQAGQAVKNKITSDSSDGATSHRSTATGSGGTRSTS